MLSTLRGTARAYTYGGAACGGITVDLATSPEETTRLLQGRRLYAWTFLDEADDMTSWAASTYSRSTRLAVVAGDDDEPVFARVVDMVCDEVDRKVHLDVLPAAPERYLEAAKRTHLATG